MNTVAIVQARMGSSRLPGKSLMDLAGEPLIVHVLKRAASASLVDKVMLATTTEPEDDQLVDVALGSGFCFCAYRGSEQDVLSRMRGAAEWVEADVVVRLTGDCPLLEPDLIDRVIAELGDADMASNILRRTYAKGLDVEVLTFATLVRIDKLARSPEAREHVTWYAYRERPDLFKLRSVEGSGKRFNENLSVDTAEDLERVRELCAT